MIGYGRNVESSEVKKSSKVDKRMPFKVNDKRLFKYILKYGEKISNLLGKEFYRNPYY